MIRTGQWLSLILIYLKLVQNPIKGSHIKITLLFRESTSQYRNSQYLQYRQGAGKRRDLSAVMTRNLTKKGKTYIKNSSDSNNNSRSKF